MKKSIFILLILGISLTSFGQGTDGVITGAGDQNNRYLDMFESFRDKINTPIDLKEMEGSPYMQEEFRIGKVFETDSSRGNFQMRYNIYNDVMEVLMKDKDIMELKKDPDVKVFLSNKRYKVYNYISSEGKPTIGYFELLEDGDKVDFLLKHIRTYNPGERAKSSFHVEKKPEIEASTAYYLYFNNENLPVELKKLKNKFITELLEENDLEYRNYIKEQDLDLDNEKDVIKLMKYLNEKG